MLITFKNLQQQTFQIEIDGTETVKALKEKIETEKGKDYPADNQRLIYAGKILTDDNFIDSYNIDEKKFIVVMVTKPKTGETAAEIPPPAPAEVGAGTAAIEVPPAPAEAIEVPPAAEVAAVDAEHEERVRCLMDMGYSRPQVEQALRASFDNSERAVEYLVTGIPEELLAERLEEEDEDPLGFLRGQPQFQQMRAIIQQDPSLLNTILQQIGQTNPALLQAISQHQQAFVRMLNEPADGRPGAPAAAAPAPAVAAPAPAAAPAPTSSLYISPQDKEAIERLKALGFPEHMVIQAYFACEKNENLAANFLLSQNFDD